MLLVKNSSDYIKLFLFLSHSSYNIYSYAFVFFQCRDALELKVLELCPDLTLLGETLDEASDLLAEHKRVLEKIQVRSLWLSKGRQRLRRNSASDFGNIIKLCVQNWSVSTWRRKAKNLCVLLLCTQMTVV